MRITIFDYGAGNLHSLVKALDTGDVSIVLEPDPTRLVVDTDLLVLPGVGAFAHAAAQLAPAREEIARAASRGLPLLGICLGMQLLFDESDEGDGRGLGIVPGRVTRLSGARVPQIGWNDVRWTGGELSWRSLGIAYYANSFVCRPAPDDVDSVVAWSEHDGDVFAAAVRQQNAVGVQFHPEKSSEQGVQFLREVVKQATRSPGVRVESSTGETT